MTTKLKLTTFWNAGRFFCLMVGVVCTLLLYQQTVYAADDIPNVITDTQTVSRLQM